MAYYLQMNGTSDRIDIPSLTFTDFEIDCELAPAAGTFETIMWAQGIQPGSFPMQLTSNSLATLQYQVFTVVYFNGVSKSSGTAYPTVRTTYKASYPTGGTSASKVFCNNSNAGNMAGKIYSVKYYNSGSLVASYDMTLGNVQDQSGNGKHATLTGGTWVSDATGTTQEGSASITGVSTITASATVIPAAITGSASLQGVATVSATADVVNAPMLGSASLQGVGTATATASVIRSGSANIIGVSTLTASAAGLAVLSGASLTGVGWVMASAEAGTSRISKVHLYANQDTSAHLMASKETAVYLYASISNSVVLEGDL